jgi:hypothetical protein
MMMKRFHREERKFWVTSGSVRFAFLGMLSIISSAVFSQEQKDQGEIAQVEIQITKSKQITLPPAERNFEKIPPRPVESIKPEITYQFKNLPFNVPDFTPVIRPLKLKTETIFKIYGNYLSAGFGNYTSPYAEAYLTNKRNKNKYYGLKFFHRSFGSGPVDDKNSASGRTELRLFGKAMSDNVALGGFLNYENTAGHFYGYVPGTTVDRTSIRQDYNIISLGGELENAKASDFKYNLKAGFSTLSDHYAASESEVSLNFASEYKIDSKKKIIINSDYFLITRKDALINSKSRQIFKVKPAYQFTAIDKLVLTAGANVVAENDTIGKQNGLHLYPNFAGSYQLAPTVEAYAGLSGDIDKVSLHTLSRENFWINSNINVFNTNRTLDFTAGVKGKLSGKVYFGAGFSFANLKNLYYYQSGLASDVSKFNVAYDNGNTQRTNLFAELGYSNEAFKLNARGDYFGYSSTIANQIANQNSITGTFESGALHRPAYKLMINSSYNIYDKVLLSVDLVTLGGIKALDLNSGKLVSLNAAADLNAKANYFVSKQFSVFLNFNNLLSSNYQLYLNYPVRGLQAMGGASWTF